MRKLASGLAGGIGEGQPAGHRGIGLEHSAGREINQRDGGRTRELGDVVVAVELILAIGRHRIRQAGQRHEAKRDPQRGEATLQPERIELPEHDDERQRQQGGKTHFPGQTGNDGHQERESIEIDEHQIDERGRHHEDALLEL